MEKKDFRSLTADDAIQIITEFNKTGGCGGSQCSTCIMNANNYCYAPREGVCNNEFKEDLKKLIWTESETTETIDTITITPETTEINYLIQSGYAHVIKSVVTDKVKTDLCKKNKGCKDCKLNGANFSKYLNLYDCNERIDIIKRLSEIMKLTTVESGGMTEIKEKSNGCQSCKYYHKIGEYQFCDAWKNYTTANMYCGYYQSIDK